MVRIIALAAVAAAIAVPASAQEIRVSLASKSADQIEADITAAARSVCLKATASESFRFQAFNTCVKDTVKVSLAKAYGTDVAAVDGSKLLQR